MKTATKTSKRRIYEKQHINYLLIPDGFNIQNLLLVWFHVFSPLRGLFLMISVLTQISHPTKLRASILGH